MGDEEAYEPRRRSTDTGLTKLVVPGLVSLCFMLAGAGILGALAMSSRITRLEAARMVAPEDVVALRVELENLKEKGREVHEQHEKELERLREWMRRHTHGGTLSPAEAPPAPTP